MIDQRLDRCPTCQRRFKRSLPQNRLYWLLLHLAAERVWSGRTYSADQFHLYYRSKMLGCDDIVIPGGKTMTIPRSTANLDIAEFSEYYASVEADLAERGVFLHELPA